MRKKLLLCYLNITVKEHSVAIFLIKLYKIIEKSVDIDIPD
ncbi:hypothetical protein CCDG5_1120 [[Clostridium] cellulosi]|uniref:Uncharacterized protein n=1 Tax=[Clostridium] cellulosi TaxID=29343 RepID=A0A078KNX1_9FIRM|nr:hypothetical protein CCDG5_1120 [[Clostridium] cellulosi]